MISENELKRLIVQKEGQFLEKKSCYDKEKGSGRPLSVKKIAKEVAEELVAFANADGGTLLIGVEDDGTPTGIPFSAAEIKSIIETQNDRILPRLIFEWNVHDHKGRSILLITVDWKPVVYRLSNGRYLLRIGESKVPFPADQIEQLKEGKRKAAYESRIELKATLNDLEYDLIENFANKIGIEGNIEEILEKYRLIEYENGNTRIKLAALLLFASDPVKWHPRCGIDFRKYEGTEAKTGRDLNIVKRARLEEPLVKLIDSAYQTVSVHIKERQYLHDLFFVEKFEYPTFAWQEAIVNAVAHRDYSITGVGVEILMFDDHIEVRSPGLPPEPVTLEQILSRKKIHSSRNPLIVRVLTDLGFMRETGEGIPRMFDEMELNGLYPPEISIEAEAFFNVKLKNQPMHTHDDIEWLKQFDHVSLNPNQKRILLFSRAHGGRFTSREYQKICGVDLYVASKEIKDMIRKGVAAAPRKRGRVYKIKSDEREATSELADEYKKLKPLLDEKGYITNSDIQQVLSISRDAAKRLANRMILCHLLTKTGRGRGVKYIEQKKRNTTNGLV